MNMHHPGSRHILHSIPARRPRNARSMSSMISKEVLVKETDLVKHQRGTVLRQPRGRIFLLRYRNARCPASSYALVPMLRRSGRGTLPVESILPSGKTIFVPHIPTVRSACIGLTISSSMCGSATVSLFNVKINSPCAACIPAFSSHPGFSRSRQELQKDSVLEHNPHFRLKTRYRRELFQSPGMSGGQVMTGSHREIFSR